MLAFFFFGHSNFLFSALSLFSSFLLLERFKIFLTSGFFGWSDINSSLHPLVYLSLLVEVRFFFFLLSPLVIHYLASFTVPVQFTARLIPTNCSITSKRDQKKKKEKAVTVQFANRRLFLTSNPLLSNPVLPSNPCSFAMTHQIPISKMTAIFFCLNTWGKKKYNFSSV